MGKNKTLTIDEVEAELSQIFKRNLGEIFPVEDFDETEEESIEVWDILPGGFNQENQTLTESIPIKKIKMNKFKVEDMSDGGDEPLLEGLTPVRRCVDCGSILDSGRYRHCRKCVRILPKDADEFIYCE